MDVVSQYIDAISLIYNQPDSYSSIVDSTNHVLYLSDTLHKIVCNDTTRMPQTLDEYDQVSDESVEEIKSINQKVLKTGKITKFIYIGKIIDGDFLLLRGIKYPIYEKLGKPVAILTIQHKLKSINMNTITSDVDDYCYEITDHDDLNYIEQLILFYASLGFSHGESYQFITKFTNAKLKFENFKYYGKQLLKKFGVVTMKELIDNVRELKECRFIPRKLLKTSIFLIKN